MIDPDAGSVLDGHAIVVKHTSESQVLDDDIRGVDKSHSILCNGSILATDN